MTCPIPKSCSVLWRHGQCGVTFNKTLSPFEFVKFKGRSGCQPCCGQRCQWHYRPYTIVGGYTASDVFTRLGVFAERYKKKQDAERQIDFGRLGRSIPRHWSKGKSLRSPLFRSTNQKVNRSVVRHLTIGPTGQKWNPPGSRTRNLLISELFCW